MGLPVLIIGKSGSGKSTSLRNFEENEVAVINVLGKRLPFRNSWRTYATDDYHKIVSAIAKAERNAIVIDDAGYLMTNQFMRSHSQTGGGNAVFGLYNSIGDSFWNLVNFVANVLPEHKIVYFLMHEDKNDFGEVKPKSIGKMLDEKVCLEGMFSIALRCMYKDGKHIFLTNTEDGMCVSKSPIGMFEQTEIDNDLKYVDQEIRKYYEFGGNEK